MTTSYLQFALRTGASGGVFERLVFLGGLYEVHVRVLGGEVMKATVANDGKALGLALAEGEAVSLHLPPSGPRVLT